jgi:hypothetical protein
MEQVIAKSTQDPEKSKFVYGNEKMNEEQNKNIELIEITKAKDGLRPTRQPKDHAFSRIPQRDKH